MIRTEKYIQTRTHTQQFFNPPPADDEHVYHWLILVAALLREGEYREKYAHTCSQGRGKKTHFLLCRALESQSIAWSNPSPLMADVLKIWKVLFLKRSKPKAWCTSATLIAPSISCLLANTARMAPFNSSSYLLNCH